MLHNTNKDSRRLNQVGIYKLNIMYFDSIPVAEVKMLPVHALIMSEENRDLNPAHVARMSKLISENGFADTIKVKIEDGSYVVLEGQHRLEALKDLGVTEVPCSVVSWFDQMKDEDEDFSLQQYVVALNAHNRKWNIYDYIKSFSKSNSKNKEYFEIIRRAMVQNQKFLSNGVIATCFDGQRRYHAVLKSDKFKFDDGNVEFSLHLIEELSDLVTSYGKKKLSAQVMRGAACEIFNAKGDKRYKYLSGFKKAVRYHFATQFERPIPDGDESFTYWFKQTVITTIND